MFSLFKKINVLLTPAERRRAFGVLASTIAMAFLEIAGIASILPFMAVLAAPEMIESNKYLNWGYEFFGFQSSKEYLFALGLGVLFLLILSNGIRALNRTSTVSFSNTAGHNISTRLFAQYLHQPYAFFLTRNSSDLRKSILNEVQTLIGNIILPLMDMFARVLVSLSILILLILVDPLLAIISGSVLGGVYILIYSLMRKWLLKIGRRRLAAQGERYKITDESLFGIKNVKLTGHEDTYANLYLKPSRKFFKTSTQSTIASELPRYALEIIAFGGVLLIILYQLKLSGNFSQTLPVITLYAFAGYRLMPNFQSIFASMTKIRFHAPVLDRISDELEVTKYYSSEETREKLPFFQKIELKNIVFAYHGAGKPVLDNLNVTIPANSSFGIVGKTGSGKTTMVDILLGLLAPDQGELIVDGATVTDKNRRAWQQNCAYVTQHIYLSDDTIGANIALGVSAEDMDDVQLKKSIEMASLSDFISSLPDGLNTIIGENGVRLSGGQRQRIGLARALYLDRPVLVLDEATSALDHQTEEEVMQAINKLGGQKTIIMIAHRLNSLKNLPVIIDLTPSRN